MDKRRIFITGSDARRLRDILENPGACGGRDRAGFEALAGELQRAKIVDSRAVPAGVVTMNTRLLLEDVDRRQAMEFSLVYPGEANADESRFSVLSPVGTAVLGYAEGDLVEWAVPAGLRRFLIRKVLYQPEAAGEFNR